MVVDVEKGGWIEEALFFVGGVFDVHFLYLGHVGVDDFPVVIVFRVHEVEFVEVAFYPCLPFVRLMDVFRLVVHGEGECHFRCRVGFYFGCRLVQDSFGIGLGDGAETDKCKQ